MVRIYKTPTRQFDSFTLSYYVDGKRQRRLLADLNEAKAEADRVATQLTKGDLQALTLTNAERTSYLQTLRHSLGKFQESFHCPIGNVTGPDIDRWLRKLGLSPRTRNNLRMTVHTLFNFAKGRRYLPKDHDEIEAVPVVKDRASAIEIFSATEMQEILESAGDQLIPFLTLGAFAGIRHAETQRLDWKDVRFDDGIIDLRAAKAKTASRRTVPPR